MLKKGSASDDDLPTTIEPLIPEARQKQLEDLLSNSSSSSLDSSSEKHEIDISCFASSKPIISSFKKISSKEFYTPEYFKTIDLLLNQIHCCIQQEINGNNDQFQFKPELKKIVDDLLLTNKEEYQISLFKSGNINLAEMISTAFAYPQQNRDQLAIDFVSEYREQYKETTALGLRCDLFERISSTRESLNMITTKFLTEPELELDDINGIPPALINLSKNLYKIKLYASFVPAIEPFISGLEEAQKSLLFNAKSEIKNICTNLLKTLPPQISLKKEKDSELIKKYLSFLKKSLEKKKSLKK